MNRVILSIILVLSLFGAVMAADEYTNYQTVDRDAFTLYYQVAGAETAARYNVTATSISLIVVGGTAPGTKAILLNNTDTATFKLFQSSMIALAGSGRTACQGTWVVNIAEDVSPYYAMTSLDLVAKVSSNCYTTANVKQLALAAASANMLTYRPTQRNNRKIKIKYAIASVTGTSPLLQAFNASNTALGPSISMTSGSPMYYGTEGCGHPIAGSLDGTTVEVRCQTTGAMTSGSWLLVGYTVE
jgi:hypothetical protein